MKRKLQIAISSLAFVLILGIAAKYMPTASGDPVILAISSVSELGDSVLLTDVRNTTIKVAVIIENASELYAVDIQFNWTTQWIHYTDYTVTIPVESYPDPIPPSPYNGTLHQPYMQLRNVVDEADAILGAEPGTMAWFAYSSMSGAPPGGYNGSGTICVFTFNVTDQPFDYEGTATIKIHFVMTTLSDPPGMPITHSAVDLEIPLHPRVFEYPSCPMLKVTPENVTGYGIGETFSINVTLMGNDGEDLDPFWDVSGCDFYLNFNSTMLEALEATIDPDGDFAAFWGGIFAFANDTETDYVHIAFMGGLGTTHSPVYGKIRIATITFNVTYESELRPVEPIDLENPLVPSVWYILDAKGEIIDLSTPVGTDWFTVYPNSKHSIGFNLTRWDDEDDNGELSVGDQIILLNKDTLKGYDYYVNSTDITLNLTQLPFQCVDDYLWATDSWTTDGLDYCGLSGTTTASFYGAYDGEGHAYWTGNFSVTYPFVSVNSVTANFVGNSSSRVLTEGVDYKVYADEDKIELLVPIDVDIINEMHVDVNGDRLDGWPWINYTATSIQSVNVLFPNGTFRGTTGGFGCFETTPPCEWWYEPDYPCELEGWYVLGYAGHDDPAWPVNSTWWINYTAGSYLTVDYNAEPEPRFYYMEMDYDDFMALGDPMYSVWHEVYPWRCNSWNITGFDDTDMSGDVTVGDTLTMNSSGMIRDYDVNAISTNIQVLEKPCVQDKDPSAPFYTAPVIVEISGFPHPERTAFPWYGSEAGVRLPNDVENAEFQAIPEFSGSFAVLALILAMMAIVITRKLLKKN